MISEFSLRDMSQNLYFFTAFFDSLVNLPVALQNLIFLQNLLSFTLVIVYALKNLCTDVPCLLLLSPYSETEERYVSLLFNV